MTLLCTTLILLLALRSYNHQKKEKEMNDLFAIADNIKFLKEQYMLFAYSQNQLKEVTTALYDKILKSIIEERKIHLDLNIRVLKKEFPYRVHKYFLDMEIVIAVAILGYRSSNKIISGVRQELYRLGQSNQL